MNFIFENIFLNWHTPRTLELFVESLLNKTLRITNARNAKTLSPSHMKQCIMSEARFDFLKELVKNVPDINVDEMQTSGDDHTSAAELTMPYQKSSVPATSCESSSGGTSKSIRSIPSFNGNSSTTGTNTSMRNGSKRNCIPTATSTKPKPQLLLKTQSMDQSLLTNMSPTSSYHTPNFYTEISDNSVKSPTTVNSVIQFTPKIQNDLSLDVRPPKLTRIDSAPGCLNDIQNAAYQTPYSQSDTPPVMTFDFTKTALPPPLYPSGISARPPIPPLTPILNNLANTSLHSPYSYPSTTSTLTSPLSTTKATAPTFIKIDASKTNNFTNTNSSTSLPSKPMAPILNIDLSNSFNISQPIFGSINSSNNLEMDEDYDNIWTGRRTHFNFFILLRAYRT